LGSDISKSPSAATPAYFTGVDGKPQPRREAVPGGKSVGVPGNIAMLAMAHKAHGKLAWATLFQPAIDLARGGYDVTPRMARAIAGSAEALKRTPEAAALFLTADGSPRPAGSRIVNEPLARTLEAIAARGPSAFYTGPIAADIVVNCAGMWARELAAEAGVTIPLHAAEHFYVVTEAMADLPPNLPVLRDPDNCTYIKPEPGKLLVAVGAGHLVGQHSVIAMLATQGHPATRVQ